MKLTEDKLRQIIREEMQRLDEDSVGSFTTEIEVVVNVDKSNHAEERQGRHGERITDQQILATSRKGLDEIKRRILLDEIDVGDEIVIRDHKTDLNVVCVMRPMDRQGRKFELTVITVMRKENFKPKSGTKVVDVFK